ncbi:hypothetical protein Tco_0884128 [Tanacetum coccineum]
MFQWVKKGWCGFVVASTSNFCISFAPMNGTAGTIFEEASRATAGHDSSNVDDDRKGSAGLTGKSGQSIAFSPPDLGSDATNSSGSISRISVVDSSSRNINLGANNRSSRSPIPTSVAATQSSHHLHV